MISEDMLEQADTWDLLKRSQLDRAIAIMDAALSEQ